MIPYLPQNASAGVSSPREAHGHILSGLHALDFVYDPAIQRTVTLDPESREVSYHLASVRLLYCFQAVGMLIRIMGLTSVSNQLICVTFHPWFLGFILLSLNSIISSGMCDG